VSRVKYSLYFSTPAYSIVITRWVGVDERARSQPWLYVHMCINYQREGSVGEWDLYGDDVDTAEILRYYTSATHIVFLTSNIISYLST